MTNVNYTCLRVYVFYHLACAGRLSSDAREQAFPFRPLVYPTLWLKYTRQAQAFRLIFARQCSPMKVRGTGRSVRNLRHIHTARN